MRLKRIGRRQFLERSVSGLLATGLGLPLISRAASAGASGQTQSPKIIYRTLGRTKLQIPVVSFGVMNTNSPDLLRKAIDIGIRHFDTANGYLRGNSEKVIGEIVEETKSRDKVYIATKVHLAQDEDKGVFLPESEGQRLGATAENFNNLLDISLRRLRTDYVDIFHNHGLSSAKMVNYEPLMEAQVKIKKSGKARFIGLSTHSHQPEVIRAAADAGIYDVVLTAYNFSQKNTEEMNSAIRYAAGKGVGIIAMKTQRGVQSRGEPKTEVDHRAALKWALSNEDICTAIPGITSFDQMDLDFSVMNDLALSPEEKKSLELASMVNGPLTCFNCRSCIPTCRRAIEIPTLIRAHMYAEEYGNLIQAELTVNELPEKFSLKACRDCTSCSATCPHGINIRTRLESLIAGGFC